MDILKKKKSRCVYVKIKPGATIEDAKKNQRFTVQLQERVQENYFIAKIGVITLKLMVRDEEAPVETAKFMGHGFCNVINKSTSLNNATNGIDVITKEVISICKKQNIDPKEMRGIGIQITKLEPINSKPSKGAINKFLSSNKPVKKESRPVTDMSQKQSELAPVSSLSKLDDIPEKKQSTTSKSKIIKQKKKSPSIALKSPPRKRGRPPKKILPSSKKVINFLHGDNVTRDLPYKDPMIKEEVNKEVPPSAQKPKGLLGLPWDKVRWLESGQSSLQCDIDLIVEYLQEMVVNKNTEKLFVLMNFLRRMTKGIGRSL